jgi:hypothetical protein
MKTVKTITVGELIKELSNYPNEAPLFFGSGDLQFYRVKDRGSDGGHLVQIEFSDLYEVTQDNG